MMKSTFSKMAKNGKCLLVRQIRCGGIGSVRWDSSMTETTKRLAESFSVHQHEDETETIRMQRRIGLSRAITLVESKNPQHQEQANLLLTHLLQQQQQQRQCFRLGIAGPPGAGKSTLIESLGKYLLSREEASNQKTFPSKLAVVCIDPSSTVTGGSILGDKTRMIELARNKRVSTTPITLDRKEYDVNPKVPYALFFSFRKGICSSICQWWDLWGTVCLHTRCRVTMSSRRL